MIEFTGWPKIHRLSRDIIITEKLDGTNAQVCITEDGGVYAGSRTRWLTPDEDNFGFCAWVDANIDDLLKLGPGRHFGEWYGKGIQRGYGLKEKRFALFNAGRWVDGMRTHTYGDDTRVSCPRCCTVVPIIWQGEFNTFRIEDAMLRLKTYGSYAAPGFMNPEGIVVYHTASRTMFKKTYDNDAGGKPE